jgi:hypothetical protein
VNGNAMSGCSPASGRPSPSLSESGLMSFDEQLR